MKTFLLFLIVVPHFVFSQDIILAPKDFYFYNKIETPIDLLINDISIDDFIIEVKDGEIFKRNDEFFIKFERTGLKEVKFISKKDTDKIFTKVINVVWLPDPEIGLTDQVQKEFIYLVDLVKIKKLIIDPNNHIVKDGYQLKDFYLTIKKDSILYEYHLDQSNLTPEILEIIVSLKAKDRIWLEGVRIISPDKTVRSLSKSYHILEKTD